MSVPVPQHLAGFELVRPLGTGGMAEVFLAKKRGAEGTFKLLVLKRILPEYAGSRRFRAMFVEEAQLATRLNHPNIVQVYEFSDHGDEGLLLSMEFVDGCDLARLMSVAKQNEQRVPPYVAAFLVAEAAKGLHYAHERRDEGGVPLAIVHRDVSPHNILVSYEGVVKIADFGIASANLFREEVGVLKGKFGYMSPEQARGEKVDRRSDIYSLGVVFYELLCLRSPYDRSGGEEALLDAVRHGRFLPPRAHVPDIPQDLEAIVMKALALDREQRFQTGRDFAAAVGRTLLELRELVDAASVEQTLSALLIRERSAEASAGTVSGVARDGATQAAVRLVRTDTTGGDGPRPVREVRHVAVVSLRVDGIERLEDRVGPAVARRHADLARSTLQNLAFKHGAVFSWDGGRARAIVGLLANPSRAAFDAATLAVDTHEVLAGLSEDLPTPIRAGVAIVRGIASGVRDDQGHLEDHELQEPATYLADVLGERTPFGATYVAGGVYRLVRREFRWGDAPTLELVRAGDMLLPQQMRLYALVRPLTREERMTELALAPNDLVGRDAEKADLFAAYHAAVSSSEGPRDSARPPPIVRGPELGAADAAPPSRGGARPPASGEPSPSSSLGPVSPSLGPPAGRGELTARVVVGEMGIGKTALIATFLGELPSSTHTVQVECSPVKAELPLATVTDVLRDITGVGIEASLEEAAVAIRQVVGAPMRSAQSQRIVTRLAELVTGKNAPSHEDEGAQYRRDLLVHGLRLVLGSLARGRPLVVVIDGLQWADRPSLEILRELLRRQESLPILVLLVSRPEDRVLPFLEGLVRIELRGLSAEEQIRLVEARLGVRQGVAAICSELLPRVAGNPFFLLEMIDALLERGAVEIVERPDGSQELVRHDWGDRAEALPSTLEQLIGDRLRELPPEEHAVVEWLAIAGGPLHTGDVLSLARLPNDEAVTRLCARGLCDRKGESVDFRHPLARDVAYLALDSGARARMHRALGEHLASTPLASGLSAAIVARHLARGELPLRAADLFLEAASAARSANQAQLAERYYQRALALLPTEDARCVVAHDSLEGIYRHLGRRRERRRHLLALRRIARDTRSARTVALALSRSARFDIDEGRFARSLPIAQKAGEIARIARQPSLEVEANTMLAELLRQLGDAQGALRASDTALAVAQGSSLAPRIRAEALRTRGVLLRYVGRVREAVESHAEAIAVFAAVGARRSEARARNALAFAMFVLERFEDTIALGLSSLAIDVAIGGRFQLAKTLSNVGQAFARLGDLAKGQEYLRRARAAHERYGDQDSRADTLLSSAWVSLEAGDIEAARSWAGDASALIAATGAVYDTVYERVIRALVARSQGDAELAASRALEARQLAENQGLMTMHVYATAIEAASRVDSGELQAGALLARTALGAVETSEANEYGIEVRALTAEALRRAAPSAAADATLRAAAHVRAVAEHIRDPQLRETFLARPVVDSILRESEALGAPSKRQVGLGVRERTGPGSDAERRDAGGDGDPLTGPKGPAQPGDALEESS